MLIAIFLYILFTELGIILVTHVVLRHGVPLNSDFFPDLFEDRSMKVVQDFYPDQVTVISEAVALRWYFAPRIFKIFRLIHPTILASQLEVARKDPRRLRFLVHRHKQT